MLEELLRVMKELLEDDPLLSEPVVKNYMKYFQQSNLSVILIKILAWIIQHAGFPAYRDNDEAMHSLSEGLKILFFMKNSDWLSQCWVIDAFQSLLQYRPQMREEVVTFLQGFRPSKEEVRLKIYELQNFGEKGVGTGSEERSFDFGFLSDFVSSKKGKYFDNEIANQYLSLKETATTSLKFKNEENSAQVYKFGGENDELIVNEKNLKWNQQGLVKKEKTPSPKKAPEHKPKKPFQIFDEMEVLKPPAKPSLEDEEEKRQRQQAEILASKMFQSKKGEDLFADMTQTK